MIEKGAHESRGAPRYRFKLRRQIYAQRTESDSCYSSYFSLTTVHSACTGEIKNTEPRRQTTSPTDFCVPPHYGRRGLVLWSHPTYVDARVHFLPSNEKCEVVYCWRGSFYQIHASARLPSCAAVTRRVHATSDDWRANLSPITITRARKMRGTVKTMSKTATKKSEKERKSNRTLMAASLASAPELQKNTRSAQLLSTSHFASCPCSTRARHEQHETI